MARRIANVRSSLTLRETVRLKLMLLLSLLLKKREAQPCGPVGGRLIRCTLAVLAVVRCFSTATDEPASYNRQLTTDHGPDQLEMLTLKLKPPLIVVVAGRRLLPSDCSYCTKTSAETRLLN